MKHNQEPLGWMHNYSYVSYYVTIVSDNLLFYDQGKVYQEKVNIHESWLDEHDWRGNDFNITSYEIHQYIVRYFQYRGGGDYG